MSSTGAKPAAREWLDGVEAVKEEPVKEEPVKEEPVMEEAVKEEPLEAEPMGVEPLEVEPLRDRALKESSPEGPIETFQPPAAGSAKTPTSPSGKHPHHTGRSRIRSSQASLLYI